MAQPNLEHLRSFLVVLRVGSISRAAPLIGLSQPTVSAHIRSLEEHLGFALFDRTAHGVAATPKAISLAREIESHVDALDDVMFLSRGEQKHPAIDLGGPVEYLTTVVLPRLATLSGAAESKIRVRFDLAAPLLTALQSGELDIVVSAVQPQLPGIVGAPLYDEEFVLVASPGWRSRLAGVDPIDHELAAIPLIAYAENLPIVRRYWRTVFERRPDDVTVAAVIPDLRGIVAALVGGAGMSVLPLYLVVEQLAAGTLVVLHTPVVSPLNTVHLATRRGDLERNRQLRALAQALSSTTP
ncbi:LysR family transcriptional regulator [Herbiconiux sp. 11R-BC]|uniref:LysR family transcriptional regulator n=1 Tax=Herbiconiux sp. 11R-BC TaxID=3111637 RepID=UPI003C100F9C